MNRFLIQNELRRCYKVTLLNSRCTFLVPFFRYKSHYSSLGLDSTASTKDIKSAYYKLSLKHHPDKNDGSPESVEKFRQIAEAYEVLGNPEKKKEYDRDFPAKSDYYTNSRGHHQDARTGYYYRAAPRTGRDQYYNYEEHIRKHYEQFYREREEEQENLRRYHNRYYQNQKNHQYYRARPPNYPPRMTLKELLTSKASLSIMALWGGLVIMSLFTDGDQVRPKDDKTIYYNVHKSNIPRPIYYNVNKEKDNDVKE